MVATKAVLILVSLFVAEAGGGHDDVRLWERCRKMKQTKLVSLTVALYETRNQEAVGNHIYHSNHHSNHNSALSVHQRVTCAVGGNEE